MTPRCSNVDLVDFEQVFAYWVTLSELRLFSKTAKNNSRQYFVRKKVLVASNVC